METAQAISFFDGPEGEGPVATKFTFFAESERIEVRIAEIENRPGVNGKNAGRLDSTVTVQAGAFLGSFKASFTTDDLEVLHSQLESALRTMEGTISFQNFKEGLELSIKLLGDGKASITGVAKPKRLPQGTLFFSLNTDHFALIRTLRELEGILRKFPSEQTTNSQESRA